MNKTMAMPNPKTKKKKASSESPQPFQSDTLTHRYTIKNTNLDLANPRSRKKIKKKDVKKVVKKEEVKLQFQITFN
jgi:hypothetical protein